MQYQTLRSLAISLAIVLSTIKSANGFTIRTDGDLTKDLEVGASSLEETRYKNAPSNAKQLKGETDDRVLTVVDSDYKASELHDAVSDTSTNTTKVKESKITEISRHEKDNNTMEISSSKLGIATVNENSSKITNERSTSAPPTTAKQDSVNESNYNSIRYSARKLPITTITEHIPTVINTSPNPKTNAQKSPVTISEGEINAHTSLYTTTYENPKQHENRNEITTTENTLDTTSLLNSINTTEEQNETDAKKSIQDTHSLKKAINNDTSKEVTSKPSKETDSTTVLSSTESKKDINSEVSKTRNVHPNIVSTLMNYETTTKFTNNGDDIATEDPLQTTQAITNESETNLEINSPTTTDVQITEAFDTYTIKSESSSGSPPHWKKYKTINRKRPAAISTEETTSLDLEMTRAETARIALADLFSNTPIPSLEELKTSFLNPKEYTTRKPFKKTTDMDKTDTSDTMLTQSVSDEVTTETQTSKLGIVSSLRAGYIDNTETTTKTTEKPQITATYEEKAVSNDSNDKEDLGTMYETDAGDSDMELPEPKNATGAESQSQLVEDAIKEELLMEKTISDNELLKIRHRQVEELPATISTSIEMVTEDILKVKPIGAEKKTMLYVVSPNYKPLKKLDVQPSKQFLRNPDDNSWRNESISSLGIVFKPKNATKSFTEVLKNKTTELAYLSGKSNKNDLPDLRVRLEKIAEVRKSKKKRINKYGDTVYSDYEENSVENGKSSKEDVTSPIMPLKSQESDRVTITTAPSTTTLPPPVLPKIEDYLPVSKEKVNALRDKLVTPSTSSVKSRYHIRDYDTSEDYYADYTLPKIDLKKFTVPLRHKDVVATRPPGLYPTLPLDLTNTKPMRVTYMPDRQPTIQYFPPTKKNIAQTTRTEIPVKVNVNDYDEKFKNKVNLYTNKEKAPKTVYEVSFGTASPVQTKPFEQPNRQIPDKNLYITNSKQVTEPIGSFAPNDGSFNRASYVIKHYKDFIDDASKSDDGPRPPGYLPYTESPLQGVTMSDVARFRASKDDMTTNKNRDAVIDYDYDTQFRKDVLNRFVDNFNQNSEKFKVDFPILYNNSVVHRKVDENGKVLASSTAFLKRMYDSMSTRPNFLPNVKPCDPNCDPITVDLSPAYELHYYVPDQEEKEEIEHRPPAVPYRFRL